MRKFFPRVMILLVLWIECPCPSGHAVETVETVETVQPAYPKQETFPGQKNVFESHAAAFSSNLLPSSVNTVHVVKRVIDGDTLVLQNGDRVRLIGVDTPETVHPRKGVEYFGKEASQFTKRMIEGKKVRLEYDWQDKDRYGRRLAYVYRSSDQFFLNAEIIRGGYGHAYTRFPFKYMDLFRKYEKEARMKERGLWKKQ